MNALAYFPMYPDDFEADTAHLTLAEDGAYNRLLRLCWRTPGCSIPAEKEWIYRRLRALSDDDRAVIDTVLEEFFTVESGRCSNARLTKEWVAANEAYERRKNAGSKGGKAKSLKTLASASSNTVALAKQPEPEPEPVKKEEPNGSSKKRGSRLSPDWRLPKGWGEWAASEGLDDVSIRREADKFRDYWISAPATRAVKRDWQAVWRNWVRKVLDDRRAKAQPRRNGSDSSFGAFGQIPERC